MHSLHNIALEAAIPALIIWFAAILLLIAPSLVRRR